MTSLWNTNLAKTIPCLTALVTSSLPQVIQTREMSKVKTRHTHPRHTWPVKRRERHDEELTEDNRDFVKHSIYDRYGPTKTTEESDGMPYVSPLRDIVHNRGEWHARSVRTGLIGRKIGVYPVWEKSGKKILTTLIQIVDNHVIKYIPPEVVQMNYGRRFNSTMGLLLVGAESGDPQRYTKEYCGLFAESGLPPKAKICRFMITPESVLQPGTPLYASHYKPGQYVDVFSHTIDRGFQGVMKRWGFKGMPATHGVTKSHRRGGNTGGGGEKGRIWPGTKVPGHMGNQWRKLVGQKIIRINTKYNVIFLKGPAIPGGTNSYVTLRDTFLRTRALQEAPHFPTYYPNESEEPLPEELMDSSLHDFSSPTLLFEDKK